MVLRYICSQELPPLAWCARITPGSNSVLVLHGISVETAATFFCDGAWAGSFEDQEIESHFLAGSGGKLHDRGILIACPSHTLEKIAVCETPDGYFVSNSLVFALVAAGDQLDPSFPFAHNYLRSYRYGPDVAARTIPTLGGRMLLFYRKNILITAEGRIEAYDKPDEPDFTSFASYVSYLDLNLQSIIRNAGSESRRCRYRSIVTVSGGYDSSAAAVLSYRAGCTDALTFRRFDEDGNIADHGGPVASALGLRLMEEDQYAYLKREDCPEAEFLACGYTLGNVAAASWEAHLNQRLLITGTHGDVVWSPTDKARRIFYRGTTDGSSFTEFRLRVNFIYCPLPFVGGTRGSSLLEITRSDEMKPWTIGGSYDRPIPRRIVEEAGIPRSAFAVRKYGSIVKFSARTPNEVGLELPLSHRAALEVAAYLKLVNWTPYAKVERVAKPLRFVFNGTERLKNGALRECLYLALAIITKAVFKAKPEHVLNAEYGMHSVLPHWGIAKVSERYGPSLKERISSDQVEG